MNKPITIVKRGLDSIKMEAPNRSGKAKSFSHKEINLLVNKLAELFVHSYWIKPNRNE